MRALTPCLETVQSAISVSIGVFSKPLTPGLIKTRISAMADGSYAVALSHAMLTAIGDVICTFRAASCCGEVDGWLFTWEGHEVRSFPGMTLRSFPETRSLVDALEEVTTRLVQDSPNSSHYLLWPGDCPTVSASDLCMAVEALAVCDVVLLPARDGGYCLVGFRSLDAIAGAFQVGLGTASALAHMVKRVRQNGASVTVLEPLSDIDTLDDLIHSYDAGELPGTEPFDFLVAEAIRWQGKR